MVEKISRSDRNFSKAYIITVDMGYGHQRAVYPLFDSAAHVEGMSMNGYGVINANNYGGIPKSDERKWSGGQGLYETISRMKHLPLIGEKIFGIMDYVQRIEPFYPHRDLSKPTMQLKQIYALINKGWGKHLIDELNKREHLPYITSFFTTAFFADVHGYTGKIYCICTDTDVSRAWVPLDPRTSKINYLVPNRRVKERLQLYGVVEDRISITGFPLPKENIGGKNLSVLKKALGERIIHLDPEKRYRNKYTHTIQEFLGSRFCTDICVPVHPLTITFAVGGAGAQRELGATITQSLYTHLVTGQMRLNLVAGTRNDVCRYYQAILKDLGLDKKHSGVSIVYADSKFEYFKKFNEALNTTDVLWTKPSELSFYAGLGIPIIMAPSVGSQENFNKQWLEAIGAGVAQEDPQYAHEWFFDWLKSGWLASAAMQGFLNAPRNGAYHVEEVVLKNKKSEIEDMHLL
ncbi:MAG: hypothetical protein HYV41_04595 [Candidatus Magasanikbacteria bacterium]|nr:hypothetical protein [Candidatus Magasanikbacteria bacterium]